MMNKLSAVDWIAVVLVIIGGVNWGLVGAFDFNVVDEIFGAMSAVSRVIYVLVGLSGIYLAVMAKKLAKQ